MDKDTDTTALIDRLRLAQLSIAAHTIVIRAATIPEGRRELRELILSLSPQERLDWETHMVEAGALRILEQISTPEATFKALEDVGRAVATTLNYLEAR